MDEFRLRFQHLYDSDPPLFADTHASSADSSCLIRFSFHCQPAFWAVIEEAWNNALLGDHNVKFALFGFHTEEELFQAVIDVNEKLPAFCDALSDILDEYPNHELRNFENQLTNVVETLDIPWFNFLEEGDNFDRAPECWVISMGLEFYLYVLTQPGRLSALGRAHLDGRAFSDVAGSLYSIRWRPPVSPFQT
ncbi:hypothetical protein CspeluHIS016_0803570 [Cutaneotrichosporon spelunceum]|uniref:Uncharacterized protein n=1 Tax=Cutaneotrichosporon spelunceum TaxID=1672016 RepID=A0AAD3YE29_9TREE|nr:hypothetical protein CspeluHIS016_0803570 [Cutaneotrichosporon spelunceum]